MHEIGRELSGDHQPDLVDVFRNLARRFDGAYNLVFLNALGEMVVVARSAGNPAAVLRQRGTTVRRGERKRGTVEPRVSGRQHQIAPAGAIGRAVAERYELHTFGRSPKARHCFFEWIYFANVASTMDERSVYLTRKNLGEELARLETVPIDADTIVVPVPDTSKAAADAMAYKLRVPSLEGLIRNRYTGRTFIEGTDSRRQKAETKYTPLREVLVGKRVLLVEDSIVRSTTMKVLINRIRLRLAALREAIEYSWTGIQRAGVAATRQG